MIESSSLIWNSWIRIVWYIYATRTTLLSKGCRESFSIKLPWRCVFVM